MAIKDLLNRGKYVSADEQSRRLNICRTCPHLTVRSICGKCTCVIWLKTKLSTEKCDVGKW